MLFKEGPPDGCAIYRSLETTMALLCRTYTGRFFTAKQQNNVFIVRLAAVVFETTWAEKSRSFVSSMTRSRPVIVCWESFTVEVGFKWTAV